MADRRPYNILVTGGAGFIGSHLVDALIERGETVHVIDNLSAGKKENVNPKSIFHHIDIATDGGQIEELFRKEHFDYVFHLAAMARIPECLEKPIRSFDVNVRATLYLLEMAKIYGVAGFVFSSSSSVYGEVEGKTFIGEDTPLNPISMYGLHKLAAEQLVLQYAEFYGLKASALRYFNVYGTKRQSEDGAYPNVFSSFNRDARQKGEITIFGDGLQRRDYIHVFDVVRANTSFLETESAWGDVFNVGTGETHTVNEIAGYFHNAKASYQPARVGDPRYSCAAIGKAFHKLGFRSSISFRDGAKIYLEDKGAGYV